MYEIGMNIDCTLVVTSRALQEALPEWVLFWVDAQWSGKWCKGKKAHPSQEGEKHAIFHVKHRMKPLPSCSLKGASHALPLSMNDNVKVQFFTPPGRKTNTPDFRFGSVFSLKLLLSDAKEEGPVHNFGLWNANSHSVCDSMQPCALPNYTLSVVVNKTRGSIIPKGVSLRSSKHPSPETHTTALLIGQWLKLALDHIYREKSGNFTYLRTFLRNPWSDTFFFDLHRLHTRKDEGGTNLPPILALYVVANALIVHGVTIEYMQQRLLRPQNKAELTLLLAILRDILLCFTLCCKEGMYREDMCLGKIVQDQSHPFSLRFEGVQKVFDEDDCEGRNTQGCIHVKQLFCDIASFSQGPAQPLEYIGSSPLLQVSKSTLKGLLQIAVEIGNMFLEEKMKTYMCIGDARASSLEYSVHDDDSALLSQKLGGHSYGFLLYSEPLLQGAALLEATCYEGKKYTKPDEVEDSGAAAYLTQITDSLVEQVLHDDVFAVRAKIALTPHKEDMVYVKVYAGDDTLFFSQDAEGSVEFGAKPSTLNKKFKQYEDGQSAELVKTWGECAILVTPMVFFKSLVHGKGLWPQYAGAQAILDKYSALVASYPSFKKDILPPQNHEAEYLDCMHRTWGSIREEDLPTSVVPTAHMLVSAPQPSFPEGFEAWLRSVEGKIQVHPFMRSLIHRIVLDPSSSRAASVLDWVYGHD